MNWYDADEFWPGKDSVNILVKGRQYFNLKDEFKFEDHRVTVVISFYCVIGNFKPYSLGYPGTKPSYFSLEGAIFTGIESFACCSYPPEEVDKHRKFLNKIGCWEKNIVSFIEKEELECDFDQIDAWKFIDEDKKTLNS